jgi:ATP-dependent Clp protease ATP-binding subunit ClpA
MTSNVGSDIIAQESSLGFLPREEAQEKKEKLREKVLSALRETFRPEFLNRIDEIIIFNYLGKEEIRKIVDLELNKVKERLWEKKIQLEVSDSAKEVLAERGFDPSLGARPLKRIIQKLLLDPLSMKIVSGEIQTGDKILVEAKGEELVFLKKGKIKK